MTRQVGLGAAYGLRPLCRPAPRKSASARLRPRGPLADMPAGGSAAGCRVVVVRRARDLRVRAAVSAICPVVVVSCRSCRLVYAQPVNPHFCLLIGQQPVSANYFKQIICIRCVVSLTRRRRRPLRAILPRVCGTDCRGADDVTRAFGLASSIIALGFSNGCVPANFQAGTLWRGRAILQACGVQAGFMPCGPELASSHSPSSAHRPRKRR